MNKKPSLSKFFLILLLVTTPLLLNCQQDKRIYIANDNHTDYMWMANEETYKDVFIEILDYYLDLADSTDGESSDVQSRFNCDGSYWIWIYKQNKSKSDFDRLIRRIKSGHISVPLNLLNMCYGGMPAEAVIRSMYYAGQLEQRYDLRFLLATSQETQTLPYGVGALWAGAGAKYSWKGICGCATKVPDAWDREHDIYWWVGQDNSRVLMKWNSMLQGNAHLGGYAEARSTSPIIDYVDSNAAFKARFPYNIVGVFGYGGDPELKSITDKFGSIAKEKTTAARKVIVSNEVDFFEDFEQNYGDNLPSLSSSFGNEWDLLVASMAELSASVKRSVENLRTAEAMASLITIQDPLFMRGREQDREKAWLGLGLYFEHDFTADGPISRDERAVWQRQKASEFESYVEQLYADAGTTLGQMIKKNDSNTSFFVFNPLSWARSDFADFPYSGSDQIHVIDRVTKQENPFQIIVKNEETYLRIWAKDIPSIGYKVFEIVNGVGSIFSKGPTVSGNVIENEYYELTLGQNGAITSLIDKTNGHKQMVRSFNGRYINDLGQGEGSLETANSGPVSATLKAVSSGPVSHATFVTLFRDSNRIDIRNEIHQNFSTLLTWRFGFDLEEHQVWHEEVGAIVKADLVEQGGHYSSRNARYDFQTLNHFVDISNESSGMTLSNADCYFMQIGYSNTQNLDTDTPLISVLAGGQVDGSMLGIPRQGDDSFFLQRFALQSHTAYHPAQAMRFAMEHQNPLVAGEVTGNLGNFGNFFSLFEVNNPDVLVWVVKPSESAAKNSLILRVWNLSPTSNNFSFSFNEHSIQEAMLTSHIETPMAIITHNGNSLEVSINPFQLMTFDIKLSGVPELKKGIGGRVIR
ncbi:MAG: glycoside hydrolase [Candidatus Aminicenantes bacterium]|nr:glycoside hydrolase [Candidatus Aminicenantes bacterium]